jgi:hypothetical protein
MILFTRNIIIIIIIIIENLSMCGPLRFHENELKTRKNNFIFTKTPLC